MVVCLFFQNELNKNNLNFKKINLTFEFHSQYFIIVQIAGVVYRTIYSTMLVRKLFST